MKKLNIQTPFSPSYHRCGWRFVLDHLKSHHSEKGILCDTWVDMSFINGVTHSEPWVGFVHNVPHHPQSTSNKYHRLIDLEELFNSRNFMNSLSHCLGLFTLCDYTKNFIKTKTNVTVNSILHPTELNYKNFDFNDFLKTKQIVFIGHWLRNFNYFLTIKTPLKKVFLKSGHPAQKTEYNFEHISIIDYLPNEKFDDFISSNIVFLNMYDVAACNTILDCIARNTPLLINRLPAAEEYLGVNYPFFYNSFFEACEKSKDLKLIRTTNEYLKNMDKSKLTIQNFQTEFEKITNELTFRKLML